MVEEFNLENYPNFFGSLGTHYNMSKCSEGYPNNTKNPWGTNTLKSMEITKETKKMHSDIYDSMIDGDYKIFKIDKQIKNLLINTKNEVYYRRCPFPRIFLEVNLEFNDANEGWKLIKSSNTNFSEEHKEEVIKMMGERVLRGIYIMDFMYIEDIANKKGIVNKDLKNEERLGIGGIVQIKKGKNTSETFNHMFRFIGDGEEEDKKSKFNGLFTANEMEKIKTFVCNYLDFLNNPNVETRVVKWFNNEKRKARGKHAIPDRAIITINGKLYDYIYEKLPTHHNTSPLHSFWVRGHYIHFWNKERFNGIYSMDESTLKEKGYQVDDKNIISKWILPYIKGKGLLKNKNYMVKNKK